MRARELQMKDIALCVICLSTGCARGLTEEAHAEIADIAKETHLQAIEQMTQKIIELESRIEAVEERARQCEYETRNLEFDIDELRYR